MSIKRKASAIWRGTGLEGKGFIHTKNNFFQDTPYSFKTRFKNEDGKLGTNPEELIAAAHASCFSMALSFGIANAGFEATELKTEAEIILDSVDDGFAISGINLQLKGEVKDMDETTFTTLANEAKLNCPVSKALAVPITLEIEFKS